MISAFDILAGHSYNIKSEDDDYKKATAYNFSKLWACGYNLMSYLNYYLKLEMVVDGICIFQCFCKYSIKSYFRFD